MLSFLLHLLLAVCPWWVKNPFYRLICGYEIGRDVRIGWSIILVEKCRIANDTRIGHLNVFYKTKNLIVDDHVRIGHANLFRGGDLIHLGRYSEIIRTNVINSILEPDVETSILPEFKLGAGSVVTTGHWIDFTDEVTVGCRSIIGGRHSSIWTHSRQWTRPISIGDFVYMGSDVRMAPGTRIPSYCIVALGSVVINATPEGGRLIGGNPACILKPLSENNLRLLRRKTRNDLPDDIGADRQMDVPNFLCRKKAI